MFDSTVFHAHVWRCLLILVATVPLEAASRKEPWIHVVSRSGSIQIFVVRKMRQEYLKASKKTIIHDMISEDAKKLIALEPLGSVHKRVFTRVFTSSESDRFCGLRCAAVSGSTSYTR